MITGAGKHTFPSRTRPLRPQPPMVVQPRCCARVGCRRVYVPDWPKADQGRFRLRGSDVRGEQVFARSCHGNRGRTRKSPEPDAPGIPRPSFVLNPPEIARTPGWRHMRRLPCVFAPSRGHHGCGVRNILAPGAHKNPEEGPRDFFTQSAYDSVVVMVPAAVTLAALLHIMRDAPQGFTWLQFHS